MNYNIIAAIRSDKKDSKGLVPIYFKVYQGRKIIIKVSLGQKIDPGYWRADERKVERKFKNAGLINSLIAKTILDMKTKILEEKITKGTADLSAIIQREKIKDLDFFEFVEKPIKEKTMQRKPDGRTRSIQKK